MAKHSDKIEVKKAQEREGRLPSAFDWHHPMQALREDIDRLFDGVFKAGPGPADADFLREDWPPFGFVSGDLVPSVDVSEGDKAYEIAVELPGMDENAVELSLRGDLLTLSGEKQAEREEKKKDWYRRECRYGSFRRTFRVPGGVEADKIKAAMKNGVMTITLPKSATEKKKQKDIKITSA